MTVWVTVFPAVSLALARNETYPSPPGCHTMAAPFTTGAVAHVAPSS